MVESLLNFVSQLPLTFVPFTEGAAVSIIILQLSGARVLAFPLSTFIREKSTSIFAIFLSAAFPHVTASFVNVNAPDESNSPAKFT